VTGGSLGAGIHHDYATVAYEAATGTQEWASRYSARGDTFDQAFDVAVAPDGGLAYVTGESVGPHGTSYDMATVAYALASGKQQWVYRYNGPANGDDRAFSVAVAPGGARVFVTGWTYSAETSFDYATVAHDANTGALVWISTYNGPTDSSDSAYSVAIDPSGTRVYVTGNVLRGGPSYDYATLAYRASDGGQVWARRYDGPAHSDDSAFVVRASPDSSRVFVTGESISSVDQNGYGDYDYATIAYGA
jgi:hypothetical protein